MKAKKLSIAAVAVLALAAFLSACAGSDKAYETFSLAMDKLAGPGNWTAKNHSGSSGKLTVSGLSVKFPAAPAAGAGQEPEAAARKAPFGSGTLEVATVEVQKILDQKTLETLLAASSWKGGRETELSEKITLKGVSHKFENLPAYTLTIEEATLDKAVLGAAPADTPDGPAGFLKAFRLGALSYKNLEVKNEYEGLSSVSKQASARVEALQFGGEGLPGLEALDPSGLLTVMSGVTAKKADLKGLTVTFSGQGGDKEKVKGSFTIVSMEEKDLLSFGAVGELNLEGFKLEMNIEDGAREMPVGFNLDKLYMKGFDAGDYLRKYLPVIIAAGSDPDRSSEMLAEIHTLGDFLVSPVSLDEALLSGFEIKVGDLMSIKMAEAKAVGPYRAGELPLKQTSYLKGGEIVLPEDAKYAQGDTKDLYDFGQWFGLTRFKIEAEGEGEYDPASGLLKSRANKLNIADVLDFSGRFEVGGLDAQRLETLKNTPLGMVYAAMMAPDVIFGDLSVNVLDWKIVDRGLIDRSFKLASAIQKEERGEGAASPEQLRMQAVAGLQLLLALEGGEYLEKPEQLGQTLATFLSKPETLEVRLAADPPLSLKSAAAMGYDQTRILNSLNLVLEANGESAPPLKFVSPASRPSSSGDDLMMDEEDEEDGEDGE
ncbi:MAG: hypothetical protein LBP33_05235 [Candidatus Adiutrix sp.]|jgi:hypothetical protein|nr:hypothetical protein [Candidatus Adiutrix sp.]